MPVIRIYNENNALILFDQTKNIFNTFNRGSIKYFFDEKTEQYSFYSNSSGVERRFILEDYTDTIRLSLSDIQKKDGSTFASNEDAKAYLNNVFYSNDLVQTDGLISDDNRIIGVNRTVWNRDYQANNPNTIYAVLGIRLQANHSARIDKQTFSFMAESNDDLHWWIALNPTINGVINWTNLIQGSIQFSQADNANDIANEDDLGLVLESGFSKGNSSQRIDFFNKIALGSSINGINDELWIIVQPDSNGLDFFCSLTISEQL